MFFFFFPRFFLALSPSQPLDLGLLHLLSSHAETAKTQQMQHPRLAAAPSHSRRPSVASRSSSSASLGGDDASRAAGASDDESDSDDLEGDASFQRARWATFVAMFIGYGAFYLTRNSLAFTAPAMLEDKSLGLTLKVRGGGGGEGGIIFFSPFFSPLFEFFTRLSLPL